MTDDELYEFLGQRFEWNRVKAAQNVVKHGVRFTEAETVFFDGRPWFDWTRIIQWASSGTLSSADRCVRES